MTEFLLQHTVVVYTGNSKFFTSIFIPAYIVLFTLTTRECLFRFAIHLQYLQFSHCRPGPVYATIWFYLFKKLLSALRWSGVSMQYSNGEWRFSSFNLEGKNQWTEHVVWTAWNQWTEYVNCCWIERVHSEYLLLS